MMAIRTTPYAHGLFSLVNPRDGRTIGVDTGFTVEVAKARGPAFLVEPLELLQSLSIKLEAVENVSRSAAHLPAWS